MVSLRGSKTVNVEKSVNSTLHRTYHARKHFLACGSTLKVTQGAKLQRFVAFLKTVIIMSACHGYAN